MDETTHAFSPKVLDRAFTIELADADFTNYRIARVDSDGTALSEGDRKASSRHCSTNSREMGDSRGSTRTRSRSSSNAIPEFAPSSSH